MNKFIELIIKELLENIHYLSNVMVFIKPIDIAYFQIFTFIYAVSLNLLSNTSLSLETFQPSQGPFNSKSLSVYEKYLSDCTSKLKPYCGEQIFFDVFVGNQTMTNHCCLSLLNGMGKASKQKHHKLCSDIAIVQAKTNSNFKVE